MENPMCLPGKDTKYCFRAQNIGPQKTCRRFIDNKRSLKPSGNGETKCLCRLCQLSELKENSDTTATNLSKLCSIIGNLTHNIKVEKNSLKEVTYTDTTETLSLVSLDLWNSLEWFVDILDNLNRLEALGLGLRYRIKLLNQVSTNDKEADYLQQWIKFETTFRDANNAIYTTYKMLDKLESRLHLIRINSLKALKNRNNDTNTRYRDEFNLQVSSNSDIAKDYSTLSDIWDLKFNDFRTENTRNFHRFTLDVINQLKRVYPDVELYSFYHDSTRSCLRVIQAPAYTTDPFQTSDEDKVPDKTDLFRLYNEESVPAEDSDSYISRITDLNNRLLPKLVKCVTKLPILTETYMNASLYQALGPSDPESHSNTHSTEFRTLGYESTNKPDSADMKLQEPIENTFHTQLARIFSRTGLEIVDSLRCTFGSSKGMRKTIIFSQGMIKDLFISTFSNGIKNHTDTAEQSKRSEMAMNIKYSKNIGLITMDLASGEIDKLIQNHLPSFKWSPLLPSNYIDLYKPSENIVAGGPDVNDLFLYTLQGNGDGSRYLDYSTVEEGLWKQRIFTFKKLNEQHIRNILRRRNMKNIIEYDSSDTIAYDNFIPFKVTSNFQNYIPIKYSIKQKNDINGSWITSLSDSKIFNDYSADIHVEVENELYPGMYFFGNRRLNALILPIHKDEIENNPTFRSIMEISRYKTDFMFPSLLSQVAAWKDKLGDKKPSPGSFFVTYHTNLCLGMLSTHQIDQWDKISISMIFHLVSCDTNIDDNTDPIDYAENPENILSEIERIKPILHGLDNILEFCNRYKITTLTIPAALKCCYKINKTIVSDSMLKLQSNQTLDCNRDYTRCLAIVSHLATKFNKCSDSLKYVNLVFPSYLKETLLPKMASNIFSGRVNTF
ncbi:hypothetical protein BEWA_006180 [Theileria equi strain WA]|uniref:Uncharacterized protein n=1 Tax=Theileria equi strain WA TaxID=1537102 RepID=L0B248_THEEQ|nr:hypothetical protein BEWA_006180 [Theileria equi strain WA]AFZ81209.1 hypothetical protein BEWA_006180 [Theileria equi strain WA]|eukprot:XP_004830875.1 hypothetical protein BEWA_006180 [Theileria equi strain WA]